MRYNKKNNDIEAHVRQAPIHPRVAGGAGIGTLPTGTENQTLRKGATAWEATSILKTHTDGAEVTNDHPLTTIDKVINVIILPVGSSTPTASDYPIGTELIFYEV
jgi:hypothetical protein